jgi:hypothetical protein
MKRAGDIPRLSKEQVLEAQKLSNPEARFIVANYYLAQEMRKRADMQLRHVGDKELPLETQGKTTLLQYTADAFAVIEDQVKKTLQAFAESDPIGQWCLSHHGIGPVITAGLLAHLDITKAETAGSWWSFAGLNPDRKWQKGEKRPWNADLRQICWHAGQCFKRISHNKDAFYGALYRERKRLLVDRNLAGANAERAKTYKTQSAEVKKTLAKGQLPDGNIDSQACNYVVKIFLSHLHAVWYWHHHGRPPPHPYAIAIQGHAHFIRVPNSELFPGFDQAYYAARAQQAAE